MDELQIIRAEIARLTDKFKLHRPSVYYRSKPGKDQVEAMTIRVSPDVKGSEPVVRARGLFILWLMITLQQADDELKERILIGLARVLE